MTFVALAKKRHYEKNYVEKKVGPNGSEIRVYDEKAVAARWKKKVEALKHLDKAIKGLRKKVHEDLKSDDAKVRALAAIVGLLDATAMRVGNEDSVDEFDTYGATTLKKKHAIISGNKIRFKFKGKKGVEQDQVVSEPAIVKEIKALLKDKKPNDFIFEYDGQNRIRAKVVNRYLANFAISSKNLRGFRANYLMKEELKKTKDFEKALEEVAETVGHEPKTLENQYLDPALVKKYKKASVEDAVSLYDSVVDSILTLKPRVRAPVALSKPSTTPGATVGPGLARETPSSANHGEQGKHDDPSPKITSGYGNRIGPTSGGQHFHEGLDLAASVGSPIYAFDDGQVIKAGWQDPSNHKKGYGQRVQIKHKDDVKTVYGHMSKILVHVGDFVSAGDVIGLAGSTGDSTGPHVHFEIRVSGQSIDPTEYIANTRIV